MKPRKPSRKKITKPVTKSARPRNRLASPIKAKSKISGIQKPRLSRPKRKVKLVIPPILLEGDRSAIPLPSGPGQRYALGPTAPVEHFETPAELPESYGTKKLLLAARDPHWLYAHWDLTNDQQRKYNSASAHGHMALRVHKDSPGGEPVTQIDVHPESRHWFVHVPHGGTRYTAELGYTHAKGNWVRISLSDATQTPPDSVASEVADKFATIPIELPFARLIELVKNIAKDNLPLAQAIEKLREDGFASLPRAAAFVSGKLTAVQERALAELIKIDQVRKIWIGSLEVTELVREKMLGEMASISASQLGQITSQGGSVSSAFGGGAARQRGFWFNVNAELIIYGATERDARVTIGGKQIKLRGDGSFSFRFALPDGKYPLPVVATSADGEDARWANLQFTRTSQYGGGEIGAHPQDEKLKKPTVESVA